MYVKLCVHTIKNQKFLELAFLSFYVNKMNIYDNLPSCVSPSVYNFPKANFGTLTMRNLTHPMFNAALLQYWPSSHKVINKCANKIGSQSSIVFSNLLIQVYRLLTFFKCGCFRECEKLLKFVADEENNVVFCWLMDLDVDQPNQHYHLHLLHYFTMFLTDKNI